MIKQCINIFTNIPISNLIANPIPISILIPIIPILISISIPTPIPS